MYSRPLTILFDLDGTLIDSAQSILDALEQACRDCGIPPARPITKDLVGPPLPHTAAQLEGKGNAADQKALIQSFKKLYDSRFCTQVAPFPGIASLLRQIFESHPLYIVTNKRHAPTERIISHLGWNPYFAGIYSPDSITPPLISKTSLLAHVLSTCPIDPAYCVYVGDTHADKEAAEANALRCLLVSYGYGDIANDAATFNVSQLLHYITSTKVS
jgi:phosphoglycolate phosphatase